MADLTDEELLALPNNSVDDLDIVRQLGVYFRKTSDITILFKIKPTPNFKELYGEIIIPPLIQE